MERIVDDSESRRRAEEIYSRRNGINVTSNRKKYFSIYKFLFQLMVLINLAIVLIFYNNRNFIFSSDFLKQVNDFYNINIIEKINNFFEAENIEKQDSVNNDKNEVKDENNIQNQNSNNQTEEKNSEVQNTNIEQGNAKEKSEIEKINESYSFIKPINGTITSFFGDRESSNSNISGFHTGIDISAVAGTKILSSICGNVILESNEGNYGKHLKIQNNEIITLYAHCKTIYVKQGDYVMQGQEIAEVGSTGNSTGPHLHFEIRHNDEYLNPCEILSF